MFLRWAPYTHLDQHITVVLKSLTLRLLGDRHAQPLKVDAVLAADAGRPATKWMERNGAYDQRKLQTQFGRPWNINTNLVGQNGEEIII